VPSLPPKTRGFVPSAVKAPPLPPWVSPPLCPPRSPPAEGACGEGFPPSLGQHPFPARGVALSPPVWVNTPFRGVALSPPFPAPLRGDRGGNPSGGRKGGETLWGDRVLPQQVRKGPVKVGRKRGEGQGQGEASPIYFFFLLKPFNSIYLFRQIHNIF
jgi:hypothetical protein